MSGLGLLNPWGLAALGGLAVVGVIYLFYERYRQRRITGLFLWDAPEGWREGGRRLARPRASRSLLLDLLAALALALAVAAPAWTTRTGRGLVVILDGSLSMRGLDNHQRARDMAADLISSSGGSTSILLVEAGSTSRVLAGPDVDPAATRAALDGYDPHDTSSRLQDALELSRELVTGHARMHVITDRDVDLPVPGTFTLTMHVLEGRAPNLALLDASRHRTSAGESISAVVASYADETWQAKLLVDREDGRLDERTLSLEARELTRIILDVPREEGIVTLRLEADGDALEADSLALLLPEPDEVISFAVDLDDAETSSRVRKALRAAGAVSAGDDAPDLLVTSDPGARGTVTTLVIPAVGDKASTFLGPFVVDRAHLLCRDVDLTGVYWTTTDEKPDPARTTPLIAVGDRSLYHLAENDVLTLWLDPARSNITRTPAWPVLLSNMALHTSARLPGLHRTGYRPGEVPEFVPYDDPALNPTAIRGEDVHLNWRNVSIPPRLPSRPGIYTLDVQTGDAPRLTVNAIAPSESDLAGLSTQTFQETHGKTGVAAGATQIRPLGWVLVVIAILALMANWLLDRRRRT